MKTTITRRESHKARRIGIVGAGFSGIAIVASLQKLTQSPLHIVLIERNPIFAAGEAYRTPFAFHYLNVRAKDMSAYADDANHFVNWLTNKIELHEYLEQDIPIAEQFVPRLLYHFYLKDLLKELQLAKNIALTCCHAEVMDLSIQQNEVILEFANQEKMMLDQVILALGNMQPSTFSFSTEVTVPILNAWDYLAPKEIPTNDTVLIVGTGLSMIDTVLTLNQQKHQGKIYAISRHGLLPLRHKDHDPHIMDAMQHHKMRLLTKFLIRTCQSHMESGGDWRAIISALREQIPSLWESMSLQDKKQFLRHVVPYWNIHRHRVHPKIANLLDDLRASGQLQIFSGRLYGLDKRNAIIRLRHSQTIEKLSIDWLINCMGPNPRMSRADMPLVQSLFERGIARTCALDLGFDVDPQGALRNEEGSSNVLFSLGPPTKGQSWECTAVPDIRVQAYRLAKHLLAMN